MTEQERQDRARALRARALEASDRRRRESRERIPDHLNPETFTRPVLTVVR